ncbi:SDR family NAD(P)-dependent oxidoreductase [Paraburkholderia sediminicola]|uniref:SDR family NAD(P)-dependent oxidoreductase n=1 Tax=Paraburkholderia sediminicola TaxID=458836 RepID=UPI0038B91782
MKKTFSGQTVVVTGAAGGIGAAIARGFLAQGANVAAVDVNPVDAVGFGALTDGQRFTPYACDVLQAEQIRETCAAIERDSGPVAVLVNNVGGGGAEPADDIETMSDDIWEHVISLNLSSAMRFTRALVGGMKSRQYGRIVNVSSSLKEGAFGPVGTLRGRLPYVTSKMALIGLTNQLSCDLGPFGITVNVLVPGLTLPGEDAKVTKRFRSLPEHEQKRMTGGTPTGRLATGEDMAHAACFLASPASGHISGEALKVSGGSLI